MIVLLALVLHLAPWTGPSLATATPAAIKYRLTVHGAPNQTVPLTAGGLPKGWVASFCTDRFCAPFHFDAPLDRHGAFSAELALVRVDDRAPKHVRAIVSAPGAKSVAASVL